MFATLALVAALFEAALGYPAWLTRRIGHPVIWMGALIAWCDARWNTSSRSDAARRVLGLLTLCLVVALTLLVTGAISVVAMTGSGASVWHVGASLIILALLASSLIAQRALYEHVAAVASAVSDSGIGAGREQLAKIVGRDTQDLSEEEVCRAAIESLAENFSDGVVAPVFWLTLAGLPGIAAYKAINTADSMIGHKTSRYKAFGWAAARTDDLLNLPASRLSAILIGLAALVDKNASSRRAFQTVLRDANKHTSPNAGYPESAMAGALGLALAGPRDYDGKTQDAAWMGDGRKSATPDDVRAALKLYKTSCAIQLAFLAAIAGLVGVV